MKNTFALLVTLILWLECHAQNATKNYWEFGYQVYGLPVPDMDTPLGIILKAGYDIVPYKKKLIVSVQPYIGAVFLLRQILKASPIMTLITNITFWQEQERAKTWF